MAKSNKTVVPEAREALDRFKMEAASEVGVNLKQGYNGDLTSKQAGSVGGQMVNVMCPVRLVEINRANWSQKQQKMSLNYEFYIAV
ncbi:MAG: alpha/beta-type small acid-soluble spore protein [Ruminococcaceae bacterium]|nr:alpha/beta-type small acid-soluble spore protein [Oscillospiraceae bacterium]